MRLLRHAPHRLGPREELPLLFFRLEGMPFRQSSPSPTRRGHRTEPRAELLRLQKAHSSRNGLPAMPSQLLHKRVTQAFFLQGLPPAAADPPMEMPPTRGPGLPTRAPTTSAICDSCQQLWYQTPHMCHSRLSTPCPLCKEIQWPLRPLRKAVVSTAFPTKPPLGNNRWLADRPDTAARV